MSDVRQNFEYLKQFDTTLGARLSAYMTSQAFLLAAFMVVFSSVEFAKHPILFAFAAWALCLVAFLISVYFSHVMMALRCAVQVIKQRIIEQERVNDKAGVFELSWQEMESWNQRSKLDAANVASDVPFAIRVPRMFQMLWAFFAALVTARALVI
jgi:hypothetical protein